MVRVEVGLNLQIMKLDFVYFTIYLSFEFRAIGFIWSLVHKIRLDLFYQAN